MSWIMRIGSVGVAGVIALAAIASADRSSSLSLDKLRRILIEEEPVDPFSARLDPFSETHPEELGRALESLAAGTPSILSSRAAAALCGLRGIGDPFAVVRRQFHAADRQMTEPQWKLWVVDSTTKWVQELGFAACLSELTMVRFEERVAAYEEIGAQRAAEVMRRAFSQREIRIAEERPWLTEDFRSLDEEFMGCRQEVVTRSLQYALEHSSHFGP